MKPKRRSYRNEGGVLPAPLSLSLCVYVDYRMWWIPTVGG
jgi:hypothetical protein